MSVNNVLDIPRFASEKEEAEWWDNNPDFLLREFEKAAAEGRLGYGTAKKRFEERQAAKSTTIRLDEQDLSLAKSQAEKKGLRYQTYLKMLIHEALVREEAGSGNKAVA
jgi:predicted DNA binding CopG/RHH family protein